MLDISVNYLMNDISEIHQLNFINKPNLRDPINIFLNSGLKMVLSEPIIIIYLNKSVKFYIVASKRVG